MQYTIVLMLEYCNFEKKIHIKPVVNGKFCNICNTIFSNGNYILEIHIYLYTSAQFDKSSLKSSFHHNFVNEYADLSIF